MLKTYETSEAVARWCQENNIPGDSHTDWLQSSKLKEVLREEVDKFNEEMADYEKVSRYQLVSDVWSPATGELSPTLKMKRKFITEKYQDLIDQIYMKQAE